MKNHLSNETSPYLLQHSENPVDWYPWGDKALAKAAEEGKPLLVSIGYSACHWCHVMEKECFEDEETAEAMNRNFVCVKVDREERPDIDHLYINAVQMISGQAGWPLNCFALSDGQPFWGGTYFPRDQWISVLRQAVELYQKQYAKVRQQAQNVAKGLADFSFIPAGADKTPFERDDVNNIYTGLMGSMDTQQGGYLGVPKFPLPGNQAFLLHYYKQTGQGEALAQVQLTLRKMAKGGIYDQLGGGFARYSTDAEWKVPHFEKMLYDNGQLLSLYADAWKITREPLFKEVAYGIAGFVENELTSPDGVFYSSYDADSEGEEGKYYVWTEKEIDDLLGQDAPLIKDYFQVGGNGEWEAGKNILIRSKDDSEFAARWGIDEETLHEKVAQSRGKMLEVRRQRIPPKLDNKVLVSWNGLMIQGLADGYAAFQNEKFLRLAEKAADFILNHAMDNNSGRLYHSLNKGREIASEGFLEDYALLSLAMIRMYEVSMQDKYIQAARTMVEYAEQNFTVEGTRFFSFSHKNENLPTAPFYEFTDNVIPSSNSVMARVMFYLADMFDHREWAERSSSMLADMRKFWSKHSSGMAGWGRLLMHHLRPFHTVVITGPEASRKTAFFLPRYLPDILLAAGISPKADLPPIFKSRFVEGRTLIYICQKGTCRLPIENEEEALQIIQ